MAGGFVPNHLAHHRRGSASAGAARRAYGDLLRAVVIETILPDSALAQARAANNDRPYVRDNGIKVDVLIYEPEKRVILKDVPLMLDSGGVADHEIWRPRPTTLNLKTGNQLKVANPTPGEEPTATHDMDGDHVLVGFLDSDYNKPVVVRQIPHPQTIRTPSSTDAQQFKWRRYLRGISYGVTMGGNVEIDLSEASDGSLLPGSPPQEVASAGAGAAGNVALILASGDLSTGAKVSLRDSALSSPEPVPLGDTLLEDLGVVVGDIAEALLELSLAVKGLGIPTPQTDFFVATTEPAFQAEITTSRASGAPYLSSHLETD